MLLPYRWTAAAWEEIDSKVVGVCAYEERGPRQGLGEEGGTYIVELASALRGGGLATQMLREARKGWAAGRGRTELQVHLDNHRARAYYRRLGMRRCRWWEMGGGSAGEPELRGDRGGSLYEPRPGYQMMQVEAHELEREMQRREASRSPVTGVEYVCVRGVRGLREAGVLAGVRAMMARVYGGEEWYVNDEGGEGRVGCLYERDSRDAHEVLFIVARLTGDDDSWARSRAGRGDGGGRDHRDDEGGGDDGAARRGSGTTGREGDGGEDGVSGRVEPGGGQGGEGEGRVPHVGAV